VYDSRKTGRKVDTSSVYDICVIGGGINGAGIARDLAGRAFNVLLLEQGDLAQATSSASTKLIHGGLRYLETYEFSLVRESLGEREVLMRMAPHIISPVTFILPHADSIRPAWMVRAGLVLYDNLGGREKLSGSHTLSRHKTPLLRDLVPGINTAFSYSDCWVDDARLVVLNAMDAAARGADIRTQTRVVSLSTSHGIWTVGAENVATGKKEEFTAKMVVNAGGPWVKKFLDQTGIGNPATPRIRLVQGSHIVVPRLYEGDHAFIFQQPDKRIVFAIPYEGKFTLIGTTETDCTGDPLKARITKEETQYLCDAVNRYFTKKIAPPDIVWTYSGVRPLFDDAREEARTVTRDYVLHEDCVDGAFLLSVFGGKLTTYRKLAEKVADRLTGQVGEKFPAWTEGVPLPGGDIADGDFAAFLSAQKTKWKKTHPDIVERLAKSYGTRMDEILSAPAGKDFGAGLFESEVRYLIRQEWARSSDDILWRRSKLGLHMTKEQMDILAEKIPQYLKEEKINV
jgi:glycerol-3-phosphate dehydrogenase